MLNLTSQQLRQAADLKEKIASLEKQLNQVLGGPSPSSAAKAKSISAAGRARIAAAQKARWAKTKKVSTPAAPAKKNARPAMSAAAKARLSQLAKARWAKVKASGKKKL